MTVVQEGHPVIRVALDDATLARLSADALSRPGGPENVARTIVEAWEAILGEPFPLPPRRLDVGMYALPIDQWRHLCETVGRAGNSTTRDLADDATVQSMIEWTIYGPSSYEPDDETLAVLEQRDQVKTDRYLRIEGQRIRAATRDEVRS